MFSLCSPGFPPPSDVRLILQLVPLSSVHRHCTVAARCSSGTGQMQRSSFTEHCVCEPMKYLCFASLCSKFHIFSAALKSTQTTTPTSGCEPDSDFCVSLHPQWIMLQFDLLKFLYLWCQMLLASYISFYKDFFSFFGLYSQAGNVGERGNVQQRAPGWNQT